MRFSTVFSCLTRGLAALLLLSLTPSAEAQVSIPDATPVVIDFAGFDGSGFTPSPASGQLDSGNYAITGFNDGDLAFGGTQTSGDYARGTSSTGGVGTGGIYAYTGADTGAPWLFIQPGGSDFTPGTLTVRYQNNTGATLTDVDLAYDIRVLNDAARSNSLNLAFSTDDASYTSVPALDFATPSDADVTPAWQTTAQSTTLSGVNVAAGDFFYVRFESDDVSGSGARDEIGLDNISLTATTGTPTPTVSFVNATESVSEGSQTSFGIEVQINDPDGTEVSVDVTLTGGTATAADFGGISTQTVTFPTTAGDGDTQTATFNLTDDTNVEGSETALFSLQNVTGTGTIGTPSTTEVTIDDDDDVLVINEIHADPDPANGDANNDGLVGLADDEFVEIVNTGNTSIDISGYTLSDNAQIRHTFAAGTVLNANQGIVVFGGGTPTGTFGGSIVRTASTGSLQLNNAGDTVTLEDAGGDFVESVTYPSPSGNQDQSITRNPDLTGGFDLHTTAQPGVLYSPGTRVDGTDFSAGSPVVRFSTNRDVANETDGTYDIIVELDNPDGNAISVDIVFNTSGSAEAADIDGFSSETITFDGSAGDVSQAVTITITDDAIEEIDEEAVFDLTNLVTSSPDAVIGAPDTITLEIIDDDAPAYTNLVINEYMYDPPNGNPGAADSGDANNDGQTNSSADEFVEIVNDSASEQDISGFTLSDGTQVRHVFPEGTVLAANQAIVVFGGGDPQGPVFDGAIVQTATDGELNLDNLGSETIILRDDQGFDAAEVTYDGSTDGVVNQSLTRNPDISGNFVAHTTAQAGVEFSPGTQLDGSGFGGGDPAAIVTVAKGTQGWRMLSPPVSGYTVGDLVPQNIVQGLADEYPDGDDNIYRYDGAGFIVPADESAALPSGEGFIWYFFDIAYDPADAGITDGESVSYPLPYMIQASGPDPATDVTVTLDNTTDGTNIWEFLGNPFDEAVDVDDFTVFDDPTTTLANAGCVWDPNAGGGAGSYALTTDNPENYLAVWQGAFFERFGPPSTATIPVSAKIGTGAEFYGRPDDEGRGRIGFSLFGPEDENGDLLSFDRNLVLFFDGMATDSWDRYDVSKLTPFGATYATLSFVGERDGVERMKAQEARPYNGGSFEMPLAFESVGVSGTFMLEWPRWSNIPEGWTIELVDTQTETTVDLREETSYRFAAEAARPADPARGLAVPSAETLERSADARFTLRVTRVTTDSEGDLAMPDAFEISAAYPNPFASQTTIEYAVPYASEVSVKVYDILGREVATLVEGTVEAGRRSATFSAAGLASGVYLVRMTADGFAQTKRVVVTH